MKLWAIVDMDGRVHIAYNQEGLAKSLWDTDIAEGTASCKEINTYDPSTQVVIDRRLYKNICYWIRERIDIRKFCNDHFIKQFLSAGEVK